MTYPEPKIISFLNSRPELEGLYSSDPEAYICDVRDGGGTKYLMLWLSIHKEKAELEELWMVLCSTIRCLSHSGFLTGLVGMEIVPRVFIPNSEHFVRILRLSVFNATIDKFLQLSADALLQKTPTPDTGCFWYGGREKLNAVKV